MQRADNTSYNLSLGIVGLPNVGKSTLFSALTNIKVPVENYPFCTIDPNIGIVRVPDQRLQKIADMVLPDKVVNAVTKFVDIAGLVKDASKGAGLGNKFLANIKEVDAIVHVVRFFLDDDVVHVNDKVDPKDDVEIIETELGLKDLESIQNRLASLERLIRTEGDKKIKIEYDLLQKISILLSDGCSIRDLDYTNEEKLVLKNLSLLTYKPIIYVFNTNNLTEDIRKMKKRANIGEKEFAVKMDVKVELELTEMSEDERKDFMTEFGIVKSGLDLLIEAGYSLLGLQSFFTAGKMEVKAWTIKIGDTAPQAGGRIHSDFLTKFICAEVVGYGEFIKAGSWQKAKELGYMRLEGQEYEVKDGDIIIFRHGA